jgi:hypothetical protein
MESEPESSARNAVIEASSRALGLFLAASVAVRVASWTTQLLTRGGNNTLFDVAHLAVLLLLLAGAYYFIRHSDLVAARLAGGAPARSDSVAPEVVTFQTIAFRAVGLFLVIDGTVNAVYGIVMTLEVFRALGSMPIMMWTLGLFISTALQLVLGVWILRRPQKVASLLQRLFGGAPI